jgi:DNA-binding MarR family transcriptional regulator
MSQRSLADRLGAVPSRVVSLIDSLEARGLVERERSNTDRRNYELRLTAQGGERLAQLRRIAEEHEAELLAPLSREQVTQLESLLILLADRPALDPDLHRDLGTR